MLSIKPPFFFTFGIRQKILLILVSMLAIALTVSGWLAIQQERKNLLTEINQRGNDFSHFMAKSLAYSVIGYDYHTIQLLLDEITKTKDVSYARVVNSKGNAMAESGNKNQVSNESLVVFTEDIMLANENIGVLTLGMDTTSITERINLQQYTTLKREAMIILIIAIVEFFALSYAIIRPVNIISKSLSNNVDEKGIIRGELPVISNDEFGMLATQFNLLRSQLNHANEQLQTKIEFADQELHRTNEHLRQQSAELKQINDELKRLSFTDGLTGLFNRRHFEELMKTEVEMSLRHGDANSLIIIDIDFFKNVNDTYGHDTGDIILREVSATMKSQIRVTDILCRVGGEEFVILCKRAAPEDALEIAEKLRELVEQQEHIVENNTIKVTISAGVASIPDPKKVITTTEFYKYADTALYFSKNNGRNRVTHYNTIRNETKRNDA